MSCVFASVTLESPSHQSPFKVKCAHPTSLNSNRFASHSVPARPSVMSQRAQTKVPGSVAALPNLDLPPNMRKIEGASRISFVLEAVNRRLNTLLPGDRESFWQVSLESRI